MERMQRRAIAKRAAAEAENLTNIRVKKNHRQQR